MIVKENCTGCNKLLWWGDDSAEPPECRDCRERRENTDDEVVVSLKHTREGAR